MSTTLSSKGQLVIPKALREQASLKQGDQLDIGYADGLIVIRKRRPLSKAEIRSLLASGAGSPALTPEIEAVVESTIQDVRSARKTTDM